MKKNSETLQGFRVRIEHETTSIQARWDLVEERITAALERMETVTALGLLTVARPQARIERSEAFIAELVDRLGLRRI